MGNTFLVMGIERFNISRMPPFLKLHYEHPLFMETSGGGVGSGSGGRVIDDNPKEVEIGPEPVAPKSLTNPQVVEIETCAASFLRAIDVIKVKKKAEGLGGGRSEKAGGAEVRDHRSPIKGGSLDCEAGAGVLPAVEFKEISSIENFNNSFRNLTKALRGIDLNILWCSQNDAPEGCDLPLIEGRPRQYLVVCFQFAGERFFLLEIDNHDHHSLSTLVCTKELPVGSANYFSVETVTACVTCGGHWDAAQLDVHIGQGAYCFVKHRKAAVENWRQRLYSALINLKSKSGKS